MTSELAMIIETLEQDTINAYTMCGTVPPDERVLRAIVWRCYMNGLRDGFAQGVEAAVPRVPPEYAELG